MATARKGTTLQQTGMDQVFSKITHEFADNAYIMRSKNLNIGYDAEAVKESLASSREERNKRHNFITREMRDDLEMGNIYTTDKNKMSLIVNINSANLLEISDQFQLYPEQTVSLEEFVSIMETVLSENEISRRDDFVEQVVDLFYRCKKTSSKILKFEQLTAYLIDHEISISGGGTHQNVDMRYKETKYEDKTYHSALIEKIHYFDKIDRVVMYEQGMKKIQIFDGKTMKELKQVTCAGVVLAVEYLQNKNSLAVSLSDRTIIFFDMANLVTNTTTKIDRTLHVPSTQKCLTYVERMNVLFSAGVDGAIFGWHIENLFSTDFQEKLVLKQTAQALADGKEMSQKDKEKREYIHYICERTPWFGNDFILCLIDLKNINLLATGSYDRNISLWDLRGNSKGIKSPQKQQKGEIKSLEQEKKHKEKLEEYFGTELNDELFDDFTKKPSKVLRGHQKAVREIAYSEKHKIIVSCGFDFEVFIWNPYLEERIMRLDGHEHPLVGVNVLPQMNSFITADEKGTVKVWSILDYSNIQTFQVGENAHLSCIKAVPKHRRLITAARKFKVYQYDKPFSHEYTDDVPITCAKYSSKRQEIFVAGERSVKVWCARSGKPVRSLKQVMNNDITIMELDTNHRKLMLGSTNGDIKIFDLISGKATLSLDSHDPQEGEISFIGYGGDDHTVVTCGWDRVIKVHMDEVQDYALPTEDTTTSSMSQQKSPKNTTENRSEEVKKSIFNRKIVELEEKRWPFGKVKQPQLSIDTSPTRQGFASHRSPKQQQEGENRRFHNRENLLRGRADAHSKDIICADLAIHLDLIATGGRDNRVRIWDYERLQTAMDETRDFGPTYAHTSEVTIVKFIAPFPLLLTTDASGQLYIWITNPHPNKGECMVSWRNAFTLNKNCPVTAVDTFYDEATQQFVLLVGDEMGKVRVQDISAILRCEKLIEPLRPVDTSSQKRNPYRQIELDTGASKNSKKTSGCWDAMAEDDTEQVRTRAPLINESEIIQTAQFEAHSDCIKSIQYISCTDQPLVFTASVDKYVKITTLDGVEQGVLRQGYLLKPDYAWLFPLTQYDETHPQRKQTIRDYLDLQMNSPENAKRRERVALNRRQQEESGSFRSPGQSMFMSPQNKYSTIQFGSPNSPQRQDLTSFSQSVVSRNDRQLQTMRALQNGYAYADVEKYRQEVRSIKAKPLPFGMSKHTIPSYNEFQTQQMDLMQKLNEANEHRIGKNKFSFTYNAEIETDVLEPDQVYTDLTQLDQILNRNAEDKPSNLMNRSSIRKPNNK